MKTILINTDRYDLPTSWQEVTYSQYVALLTVANSLPGFLTLFTGLSIESLNKAHINSVDDAWQALAFLTVPPEFKPKPTNKVGPYRVNDAVVKKLGQYGDLSELLKKLPSPVATIEDNLLVADVYLEACAIMSHKYKYGEYNESKIPEVKEELKAYSCMEVLQTGGFFLFWVLKTQQPQQLN